MNFLAVFLDVIVREEIVINDFISANNPRGQGRMDDASDNDSNDSDTEVG